MRRKYDDLVSYTVSLTAERDRLKQELEATKKEYNKAVVARVAVRPLPACVRGAWLGLIHTYIHTHPLTQSHNPNSTPNQTTGGEGRERRGPAGHGAGREGGRRQRLLLRAAPPRLPHRLRRRQGM